MRLLSALALVALLAVAACSTGATSVPTGADAGATAAVATPEEGALLAGVRLDLQGTCAPLRNDLPDTAIGAIECEPTSDVAERAAVYLFGTEGDLMAAYLDHLAVNEIQPRTNAGRCLPGQPSEGAYTPGDSGPDLLPVRGACFVDAAGRAHYLATSPPFVLIQVDGRIGEADAVQRFAWLGNKDQPGAPTLWRSDGPASPEK